MELKKKIPRVRTEVFLLTNLLILYVIIASSHIRYPGLHYDELAFVNAALGGIDNSFIVEKIGSFPVYICTYIGALKAYLYYPIFSLFGVSAISVRLPMIILTAISFFVLFVTVKNAFGRKTAWVSFLLFLSNPSIMAHTRTDNGPPAILFFIIALCLNLIIKFYNNRRKVFLLALYLICWVGIYYNIKFIWFINSIFFASLFLYVDKLYQKVRAREIGDLLKGFSCFVVAYLPFLIYTLFISRQYPLTATSLQGLRKLENLINVIKGQAYYEFALGTLKAPMANQYLLLVIALLIAGTLVVFLSKHRDRSLKYQLFFFWVILITTCLQIYVTPQARQTWHAFKIYPTITILLAVCIVAIETQIRKIRFGYGKVFIAIVLVFLLGYNAMVTGKYITAYRDKKSKPYWSEVIYDLIDYTRKEKGRFFSCTWGIHIQLISFHQDPYRFQEIVLLLNRDMTEQEQEQFYTDYLKEHNTTNYFIARPAKYNIYKKPLENLFKIADKYGVKLKEYRRFYDTSDSQDIFILYCIQK